MTVPGPSGPDTDPAGVLLRAGALPAGGLTVLVALGALVLDGWPGGASAAIGGLLAMLAFAVGPALMRRGRNWNPVALQAAALASYAGVVTVLGIAWLLLGEVAWFHDIAAAVGVLVAGGAWLAGQYRGTTRLRTLVYGDGESPPS